MIRYPPPLLQTVRRQKVNILKGALVTFYNHSAHRLDSPWVINDLYLLCYFLRQPLSETTAIVRRYPFSSSLQRMSVVTVAPGGQTGLAFIKGAPEMVASLCLKESGTGD